MTTTPDPETSYLYAQFGIPYPSFTGEINSLKANFEYNIATIKYESTFGITQAINFNPEFITSFLSARSNKWLTGILSPLGNVEIEASNKLDLYYGNELELRRFGQKWDYQAGFEDNEKSLKILVISLMVIILMADVSVAYFMEFGRDTDGSKAKNAIGISSSITTITIATIHLLEWASELARQKARETIAVTKALTALMVAATKPASNASFLTNPMLNTKIAPGIQTVIKAIVGRSTDLVESATNALNATVVP